MSENKTKPTAQSVQEFLNSIDDARRRADSLELLELMQQATKTKPTMWGPAIVGFGTHHYKYETGREGDTVAVGFSPRKAALVLYGVVFYELNRGVAEGLGSYKLGKGCLYIKDMSKINKSVLAGMITEAYKARANA